MRKLPQGAKRKSMEPYLLDSIDFYQHQVDGCRRMARMTSFLLADDMGLGKSLQAMVVFIMDVVRGWAKTCIVICPASVKGNWADEWSKFTRIPTVVLDGSPLKRAAQFDAYRAITGPKVLIVNYEQVKPHLNEINKERFDVAIFDEAHYIKNPKSVRTKACLAINSRRSFMLTGTPMLNRANELWAILHRISPNQYPRYWGFVNTFCVFGGFGGKQIMGVKNEKRLKQEMQDVMIRRLKKDVLDLPEVQIIERRVDLLPGQRKLYDTVLSEMQLPKAGEASPMQIENALTKFLRLKQICGTTLPFTGIDESAKLDLATEDDLLLLSQGEKIVVFTQFRDVQAAYYQRMLAEGYRIWQLNGDVPTNRRSDIVKEWSDHNGPAILLCMLQVAGIGLNMTASRNCSFLDELFVPGLNQQAIDRLNRIGASTVQPIQVRQYVCRNTIENRVKAILRGKSKEFKDLIETDPAFKQKLFKALMEAENDE